MLCKAAPQETEPEKVGNDHEKIRFGDAAEQWLSEVRETKKYSTYIKYRSVYEKHSAGDLGNCRLDRITDGALNALTLSGASASIQRSECCVANQVLSFICIKIPPCRFTRRYF